MFRVIRLTKNTENILKNTTVVLDSEKGNKGGKNVNLNTHLLIWRLSTIWEYVGTWLISFEIEVFMKEESENLVYTNSFI